MKCKKCGKEINLYDLNHHYPKVEDIDADADCIDISIFGIPDDICFSCLSIEEKEKVKGEIMK